MGLKEELLASDSLDPEKVGGIYNMTLYNKSSGSRLHLVGTYFEQSLILNNSEVPRLYTGFEKEFGSFNDSLRIAKAQYKILHRIDKFPSNPGHHYTLIVQDTITGVIDIIENKHYENLAEEHGYTKPMVDLDYKTVGAMIEPGSIISKTHSHDENLNYRYGINGNVAYISTKDNIEDGIVVSESFAKRVTYTSIKTIELVLNFNDILLNKYGTPDFYKGFPDIFTEVSDGIFCIKRTIDSSNVVCDTTSNSLNNITNTNDEIFHAKGRIIDIDVVVNNNAELLKDYEHRKQLLMYYNLSMDYKIKIIKHLEPYIRDKAYKVTTYANTKYTYYKNHYDACTDDNIKYMNKTTENPFEFAFVKFTISKEMCLSEGSKLTNRFGGKGVITKIIPDDMMPLDAYGVRAEIIFNPCGVVGRSNPGQMYEQELNFISTRIVDKMKDLPNLSSKFELLSRFMSRVDADSHGELVKYYKNLPTPQHRTRFIQTIESGGLYVRQHSFKNLTFEEMKQIYMEFDVHPSSVEVTIDTIHGIKKYTSKNAVVIGEEYIMVLKHTTEGKSSSVSISSVNGYGLPDKSVSKNKVLPLKTTPIKFGEMEVNIAMNRCSPEIVNRFLAGCGTNMKHRDRVAKMLIEEDPFVYHNVNIKSEDIDSSIPSDAFVSLMQQLGYSIYTDEIVDVVNIGVKPD